AALRLSAVNVQDRARGMGVSAAGANREPGAVDGEGCRRHDRHVRAVGSAHPDGPPRGVVRLAPPCAVAEPECEERARWRTPEADTAAQVLDLPDARRDGRPLPVDHRLEPAGTAPHDEMIDAALGHRSLEGDRLPPRTPGDPTATELDVGRAFPVGLERYLTVTGVPAPPEMNLGDVGVGRGMEPDPGRARVHG